MASVLFILHKHCCHLQHAEERLKAGPLLFFNAKQINILILPQVHFPNDINLAGITRMMSNHRPTVHNRMEMCTSSSIKVQDVCGNMLPESSHVLSIETDMGQKTLDHQCVLNNFPLHQDLVLGSNIIRPDQVLNTSSEKRPCESKVLLHDKQDSTSVCTLEQVAMVNNETKTKYYATSRPQTLEVTGELSSIRDNNLSACCDLDATVPSYDVMMRGYPRHDLTEKHYPNRLCNCEEIPIVPESPNTCKTGLLAVTCMDTSYQDSNVAGVPSNSPVNESYCLTLCCFAAEKESLVEEESDYELNLSSTQESYLDDNVDVSMVGSSQVYCDGEGHHDVITSPAESVNKFDIIDLSPDSSGLLVDDGGATLLQNLPLEKARQTDTEILQVCNGPIDARENTDDDFDSQTGKTQMVTTTELPNEKVVNVTNDVYSESSTKIESGKCFPMEQVDYDHAYNNDSSNLQAGPSDDHSLDYADYDGPSRLLMAMELTQRKDHHVSCCPLNAHEGMFSGSYPSKSITVYFVVM